MSRRIERMIDNMHCLLVRKYRLWWLSIRTADGRITHVSVHQRRMKALEKAYRVVGKIADR